MNNEINTDFDSTNESEIHPENNEVNMEQEQRHILNVTELDESVLVEFAKVEDEVEQVEEESLDIEEEGDRKISTEINYRTIDLSRASYIDEENRRVRIGVSSEEMVERSFGKEVLSHRAEDIDMSFMASGTAPLLLNHSMDDVIGVVEEFELDEARKRTTAVVRFGESDLAQMVWKDVISGIRRNISVGYSITKMERDNDEKHGDYYRASFKPVEASIVAIPADMSAEVGKQKHKQQR